MKRVGVGTTEYGGMYKNSRLDKDLEDLSEVFVTEVEVKKDINVSVSKKYIVNTLGLSLRSKPIDGSTLINQAIVNRDEEVELVELIDSKWGKFSTTKGTGYLLLEYLLEV